MSKLTFNFELSRNVTKMGLSHILVRIQDDKQKKKRVNTGIDVNPKFWNNNRQRVSSKDPDYAVKNSKLQQVFEKFEASKNRLEEAEEEVTVESVANVYLDNEKPLSFVQYCEEFAQRYYSQGEIREFKKFHTFFTKLKFFLNDFSYDDYKQAPRMMSDEFPAFAEKNFKKDLSIAAITPTFVQRFYIYIKEMPNLNKEGKLLAVDSVKKQIAVFRSTFHKCVREKNYSVKVDPFVGLKQERSKVGKDRLDTEEIELFRNVDLNNCPQQALTRDCFLLSYYCGGIRCGDLLRLRGSNIQKDGTSWRLVYEMEKTGKMKSLKIIKQTYSILSRYVDFDNLSDAYIFPFLDNDASYAVAFTSDDIKNLPPDAKKQLKDDESRHNGSLNRNLKRIASKAGITKNVSMHVSRHSFANLARKSGADLIDVRNVLGHSSVAITEGYMDQFDTVSQDETLEQIFHETTKEEDFLSAVKEFTLLELNVMFAKIGYKVVTA